MGSEARSHLHDSLFMERHYWVFIDTPIPLQAEHRFRRKPNTDSGASRTPIPPEAEQFRGRGRMR